MYFDELVKKNNFGGSPRIIARLSIDYRDATKIQVMVAHNPTQKLKTATIYYCNCVSRKKMHKKTNELLR